MMKKQKRKVLSRLLFACGLLMLPLLAHGNSEPKVVVRTNSGGVYEFIIADNPTITFQDNLLVIGNEKGLSLSVNAEEVAGFDFVPSDDSSLSVDVINHSGRFRSLFSSLEEGSTVDVLTLDGKILERVAIGADGKAEMDFTRLPNGVCIIRTGKGSFKIKK